MSESIDLRALADALKTLQGWSTYELAQRAAVHRPNLVTWLKGKPQSMSEQKQLAICETLGWRFGFLRADRVHRWRYATTEDVALAQETLRLTHPGLLWMPVWRAVYEGEEIGYVVVGHNAENQRTLILLRRELSAADLPRAGQSWGEGHAVFELQGDREVAFGEQRSWWREPPPQDIYPDTFWRECGYAIKALSLDAEQFSQAKLWGPQLLEEPDGEFALSTDDSEDEQWHQLLGDLKRKGYTPEMVRACVEEGERRRKRGAVEDGDKG